MSFGREIDISRLKSSAFLFGPRMTGKTTLLRRLSSNLYVDLLDPEEELKLRKDPKLFWQQISILPKGALVIVDEVQKAPLLLDYVQMGIDRLGLRFLLSGSSARKLKRGSANLLGGRALDLKLHPLTQGEMGPSFRLPNALQYGTLPKIAGLVLEGSLEEARGHLRSYITTYLKEEIQAEAIMRSLEAFQRFLAVAAQSNAQVIEFANISRECSVPMSSVKEYFSILEDTLIGEFLWPYDRSERKKARPKFYFFDCGVIQALQSRLTDPPTPVEKGFLFETWFVRELVRLRDYHQKDHSFGLWRQGEHEVDVLISGGRGVLAAIEIKSGRADLSEATITRFRKQFPKVPVWVASMQDEKPRKITTGVEVHPWEDVLKFYKKM